ncbi:putative zinc-binding metallopeptidase [Nocardia sp. CDC153]|uniref:zinc-binding metallopeptidase family protein n=1 Tax=Nocardia sp. CDC153 TaxID=3112167 RepID=UPI002DBFEFBA|nr:putative zinc-binding metallopeptidase [Nocardia sp. CDC153]MEC3955641.1 putative zinc-binding metallopeptidase [Nocardia sp. CDC153]
MRDFVCPRCGQRLAFENTVCLGCGSDIGFDLEARALLPLEPGKSAMCANQLVAQCNWLVPAPPDGADPILCESCRLTRVRPADSDDGWLEAFGQAEAAKRRLVFELTELGLPITDRTADPDHGLAFDLLASADESVTTGHERGIITLDLAEGDVLHRERVRLEMAEPYRTLLGHLRHEIGHYYFEVLVTADGDRERCRELFGDPDIDYQRALERHYEQGAPPGWEDRYVSAYATMHPAEDWAETFAHYLHIRDTLDTAAAFGFAPAGATLERPPIGDAALDRIIELWLPLVWALNMMNRSMGHRDPYPFVLADPVLDKMRLIHELCAAAGQG